MSFIAGPHACIEMKSCFGVRSSLDDAGPVILKILDPFPSNSLSITLFLGALIVDPSVPDQIAESAISLLP
jgi:hypothetical protein